MSSATKTAVARNSFNTERLYERHRFAAPADSSACCDKVIDSMNDAKGVEIVIRRADAAGTCGL